MYTYNGLTVNVNLIQKTKKKPYNDNCQSPQKYNNVSKLHKFQLDIGPAIAFTVQGKYFAAVYQFN